MSVGRSRKFVLFIFVTLILVLSMTCGKRVGATEIDLMSDQEICSLLTTYPTDCELDRLMSYYHDTKDIRTLVVLAVNIYEPALDAIIKIASSNQLKERVRAFWLLRFYTSCNNRKAVEAVYSILRKDEPWEVKVRALSALPIYYDEEAEREILKVITECLLDNSCEKSSVSSKFIEVLDKIHYSNLIYLRDIECKLKQEEKLDKYIECEIEKLWERSGKFEKALKIFNERGLELKPSETEKVLDDLEALRGKEAAAIAIKLVNYPNLDVKRRALLILGRHGYEYKLAINWALFNDKELDVKDAALRALSLSGCTSLSKHILFLASNPNYKHIRDTAIKRVKQFPDPRAISVIRNYEGSNYVGTFPLDMWKYFPELHVCFPEVQKSLQ